MTQPENCISCRRPQAQHVCGLCSEPVCRSCEIFLAEGTFQFLTELAPELKHSYYCANCHAQSVEPALTSYQETLERAKAVFFFFETRKYPIPVLNKAKVAVKVEDCVDRDETILRLGFMAASQGFNAIVRAEVKSAKVRDHAYQRMRWSGTGLPATVDGERLERHFESDSG